MRREWPSITQYIKSLNWIISKKNSLNFGRPNWVFILQFLNQKRKEEQWTVDPSEMALFNESIWKKAHIRQACSSHHQIVIWLFDKLNRSTNSETAMPSSSYPWKEGFFKTTTKWPRDKYFALRYFQKSERNPKRVHNYKCHVCMIPGPELSRETKTSLCFIFAQKCILKPISNINPFGSCPNIYSIWLAQAS